MKILIEYYNGSSFLFDNFVRMNIKDYNLWLTIRKANGDLDVFSYALKDIKKIVTAENLDE